MQYEQMLARRIEAGSIIKPWLMLGPIYEDLSATVQGLTFFEKAGAVVGRTAMGQIGQEALEILHARPSEGETATFRGQEMRWALLRGPEQYFSWGNYYISNHLGAAFLTTLVSPERAGQRHWRLITGLPSRTDCQPRRRGCLRHWRAAAGAAGRQYLRIPFRSAAREGQFHPYSRSVPPRRAWPRSASAWRCWTAP